MNIIRKILTNWFETISFDIFDTLMERSVACPQEIFRLAGMDVLGGLEADMFFSIRCEAEKKARARRTDGEVTLSEIYEELRPFYGEQTEALMQAEINREFRSSRSRKRNMEWMQWCIKEGKTVFLISDMYLPPEIITEMLERCGIRGYRKLYVSGAYRQNKVTGDLFRAVIVENQLDAKRMLHIGDSLRADILGARKAGIFAVWVKRKRRG